MPKTDWFTMARYKTHNGVLIENWDLFYARDRDMVEFRMRKDGDDVVVSVGDKQMNLNLKTLEALKNAIERWL